MGFIRPNPTAPWVYVVDRLRLRRPRLSAFTHYPCILPEETIVQLGIELRVTSSSTMGGVMLLGMVLYMMTSRTLPRLSRYGTALVKRLSFVMLCTGALSLVWKNVVCGFLTKESKAPTYAI